MNRQSDIGKFSSYLYQKRISLLYAAAFFCVVTATGLYKPDLLPIALAALVVRPIRFILMAATYHFEEDDYGSYSPIIENMTNYAFIFISGTLGLLPAVYIYLGKPLWWNDFGIVAFTLGVGSIAVLAWSESLYGRNFYFDEWHPLERGSLGILGVLSILTPLFIPLFLLVHRVITEQYQYPKIGKFNYTHSALPHSMLYVLTGFIITNIIFNVQEYMVVFLLLSAYAAHYFHAGLAKLKFGPSYYIFENNPVFLFSNAYKNGWLNSLSEETVARIALFGERIKPALNGIVIVIELGAILILISYTIGVAVGILTLLLHISILLLTGDYFWKWMVVNTSLVLGLILTRDAPPMVFGEIEWILSSFIFIAFAMCWMKPQTLGWLDSPYYEYLTLEGTGMNGEEAFTIHPDILRPYDGIISQGFTGVFTYLGTNPRITYSLGDIRDRETHENIAGGIYPRKPDESECMDLRDEIGTHQFDEDKTEELESLLKQVVDNGPSKNSLRGLSAPREFYTEGIPTGDIPEEELQGIRLVRVDGIWTRESFEEIDRTVIIEIST